MRVCSNCGADLLGLRSDAKYCGKLCRPPCSIEGCGKPIDCFGMCRTHAQRVRRYGSPDVLKHKPLPASCSVPGCSKKPQGHGYCPQHYQRFRLYGDPLAPNQRTDLQDRSATCCIDDCTDIIGQYGNKGMCRYHARLTHRSRRPVHYKAKLEARRRRVRVQTPVWADLEAIELLYQLCPKGAEVDHIYPLKGKTVSGLHVLSNLQYLPISENRRKGNRY